MTEPAGTHDVFQAIADPARRKILRLLAEKDRPISEIASYFSISRTAVTKHLQVLSESKLVEGRKEGRQKIYHLNTEPLMELKEWLHYYERFWNNKLTRLQSIVEQEPEIF